ncbi:MAG: hypothetical protein K2M79_02480 [Muribaculaceae bacterium]|nr:hypothetical protein [Muribaculaceae bacterium]
MKASAIYGEQNAGKSTACFKLYEMLLKAGGKVIKSQPAVICNPSQPPKADFMVLIAINGKTILITSGGDFGSTVAANIQHAISVQPDYFIFTIRKGTHYVAAVGHLQNIINNNVKYITLHKAQTQQEQDNNETQIAIQIFNQLL